MVDTGCTRRNFISPTVADWLRSTGAVHDKTSGRVCTAFGQCKDLIDKFVSFDMSFHDNVNNSQSTITIDATVLDMKNLQLVLGLPTISEHNLVTRMLMPHKETAPVCKLRDDANATPEASEGALRGQPSTTLKGGEG